MAFLSCPSIPRLLSSCYIVRISLKAKIEALDGNASRPLCSNVGPPMPTSFRSTMQPQTHA